MLYTIGTMLGDAVRKLSAKIVATLGSRSSSGTNHPSGDAAPPPGHVSHLGHLLVTERDETNLASSTPTEKLLIAFLVCLALYVATILALLTM